MGVRGVLRGGNAGQRVLVQGGIWQEITRLELADDRTVTIHSAATPFTIAPNSGGSLPSPGSRPPRILIRIRQGAGGAASYVYTLCGTPKKVSGDNFVVEAQIFLDEEGTVQAPSSLQASVSVHIGEGEGQDLQPTTWVDNASLSDGVWNLTGSQAQLYTGQGHLRQGIGYNDSSNPTWIMFFDALIPNPPAPIANGSKPILVIPVPGAPVSPGVDPYFSFDAIESKKSFSQGLYFACSSSGASFVYDDTATVHVEAELYEGDSPE